jgi:hypothetical protein
VGLVAGVGARQVLEVGDEGGLAGVAEGKLQAFAPRDGVSKGRDGVCAESIEAFTHQGGVSAQGVVVGGVEGAVDLGGGSGCAATALGLL